MQMQLLTSWLLIVSSIIVVGAAKVSKHERLLKLSKNHTKAMVWNSNQFNKYLKTTSSRPYAVVTLITARGSQYGCQECGPTEEAFKHIAKSYGMAKNSLFSTQPALYFAIVDIDKAMEIFQENQVNQAPLAMYFAADDSNRKALIQGFELQVRSLGDWMDYIETQHKIRIPKTVNHAYTVATCLFVSIGIALLGTFSMLNPSFVARLPWSRSVWLSGSYVVYFLSVSGMVFCIIRSPPTFQYRKGQSSFIHTSGRQQFVLEGLLVGLIQVGIAVSLILLLKCTRPMCRERKNVFRIVLHSLASIIALSLCIYLLMRLGALYSVKNNWYTAGTTIPASVKSYFLGSTKKTAKTANVVIWMRRVVKLAKYFLYDFTSVSALKSKAIAILRLKS